MRPNEHTGLVLEGGGMRGVFTSGVLDYFIDHDINFPYAVGVSAGACNGLSFWSRQRGRAKTSNIDMLEEHRYIGIKYLWTQHSILDQDFLYGRLAEVLPFDFEACFSSPMEFEMVTTDCKTGRACYLSERSDRTRLLDIVKASSSLPYVCPIAWVDHRPMLDGGIVDSIPVSRAVSRGYDFNVVVLTRNKGYRKSERDIKVPKYVYRRFPRLRVVLSRRCALYNAQLEAVERLEADGRILVIRPERPMQVDRLESDVDKLTALYNEGYECAGRILNGF